MTDKIVLCRLDAIGDSGSKGFSLGSGVMRREIFVLRHGGGVWGFENSCPHTGGMLDWVEDQFLSYDKKHILCATHGALFRVRDGYCIHGPCRGEALTSVRLRIEGDVIVMVD